MLLKNYRFPVILVSSISIKQTGKVAGNTKFKKFKISCHTSHFSFTKRQRVAQKNRSVYKTSSIVCRSFVFIQKSVS